MSERKLVCERLDAMVDVTNTEEHGVHAYALVKYNFGFKDGNVKRIQAAPLENDLREENVPRYPPYTDFWPYKQNIDVVVQGHAFAPRGTPCETFNVSVFVGERKKHLSVFGPRNIRIIGGHPCIGIPEKIDKVSLEKEEAYGGVDELTPVYAQPGSEAELALHFDHPGIYPRNQFGRGYMVTAESGRELWMPSLEDPADLLTEKRICTERADLWFRQPMPNFLGHTLVTDFPRIAYLGLDAWYYGPLDDHMPEVSAGWLPKNYREVLSEVVEEQGYHLRMRQEAPPDMIFEQILPNTPFSFYGMHPDKANIGFKFPNFTPRIQFTIDNQITSAEPKLHKIVCYPTEERFTLLFSARAELPRIFIPKIHKDYPLEIRVDDEVNVQFDCPETTMEQFQAFGKDL